MVFVSNKLIEYAPIFYIEKHCDLILYDNSIRFYKENSVLKGKRIKFVIRDVIENSGIAG